MKKFFSLVLALVMALSLTTVAWGATEHTVADQAAWDSLIAGSTLGVGDTIKLGEGTFDLGEHNTKPLPDDLTIVGVEGKTIVTYLGTGPNCHGDLTVQNCIFEVTNSWCGASIAGEGTYVFDNCDFRVADGKDASCAIYFTARFAGSKYTVKNCTFADEYKEAAVVIQEQDAPDTFDVTVSGNDFSAVDGDSVGIWNNFADSDLNLTTTAATVSLVHANNPDEFKKVVAAAEAGDTISLQGDLTLTDPIVLSKPINIDTNGHNLTGLTAGSGVTTDASGKLTSGTFAAAPAAADVADGYTVLKNTDGTYVVVPAVTMGDKFDLYLADVSMSTKLKLGAEDVSGLTFNEVGAKTNKDGSGRVAYIAANNGQFFVKTTNPTVADYAVTYAGKTDVLYYVYVGGTSAANFEYEEEVKAFTNWGLTCGKMDNTGLDMTEDYFMASNFVVYQAGDAGTGTNYLLDGVVVSGTPLGTTIDHAFVANNFKYDATTKQNIPTSAICTKCLMQSTAIYKDGKAPAGSLVKPLSVNGTTGTWVVVPGATGTVVTPSTDKVTSAETFDAGIAMYVGMSVMAAAGSVVVLKKKD